MFIHCWLKVNKLFLRYLYSLLFHVYEYKYCELQTSSLAHEQIFNIGIHTSKPQFAKKQETERQFIHFKPKKIMKKKPQRISNVFYNSLDFIHKRISMHNNRRPQCLFTIIQNFCQKILKIQITNKNKRRPCHCHCLISYSSIFWRSTKSKII